MSKPDTTLEHPLFDEVEKEFHTSIRDLEKIESLIRSLSRYAMHNDEENELHGHAEHIVPLLKDEALNALNSSYRFMSLLEDYLEKVGQQ